MTYKRFEDTPAWQAAIAFAEGAFKITADRAFVGQGDLANQFQRAALSISNNIAEGFERGSTAEVVAFLYYARGSAGEVRSMLCLMDRLERFDHLNSHISNLKSQAESCSRQIRAWADHLQNTAVRGQKHLTDESRTAFDRFRRGDAFLQKLRQIRDGKGTDAGDGTQGADLNFRFEI